MSSWKNALKSHRKIHKERAQPAARKRLGLLQKHKDYVLRARNYHKKQDLLKILREKAQNRNPDEFYYRMISQKTTEGKHVIDADEKLSKDELKLVRTQDLRYVHFKQAAEKRKIERIRAEVQLIDQSRSKRENKHHFFVEDQKGHLKVDISKSDKTNESIDNQQMASESESESDDGDSAPVNPDIPGESKVSRELSQRMARERTLSALARKMEVDQTVSKDKPIITTRTEEGNVVHRWRKERKK